MANWKSSRPSPGSPQPCASRCRLRPNPSSHDSPGKHRAPNFREKQAPSSNIQHPENVQTSSSKRSPAGAEIIWDLRLGDSLDVGCWSLVLPMGPDVHTVMARASIASAQGSFMTRIAAMTRSTLASGSPFPGTRPRGCARPRRASRGAGAPARRSPTPRVAREAEATSRAERARERAPGL